MRLAGLTLFLQLVVVDVIGLKTKHVPGHPVAADHSNALFRASRALSNTNKSVAIFIHFYLLSATNA